MSKARDLAQKAACELHYSDDSLTATPESLFRLLLVNFHRALQIERHGRIPAADRRQALVAQFRGKLDHHLDSTRSVTDFAEMLAVTPTHLSRMVKALTGRTAGELIADRLPLETRRRLVISDTTAAKSVLRCSFPARATLRGFS